MICDPLDEKILKANIESRNSFCINEDDEDNIMSCVLAEKYTLKKNIAIINKQNYNILQESLKIDDLVDPEWQLFQQS